MPLVCYSGFTVTNWSGEMSFMGNVQGNDSPPMPGNAMDGPLLRMAHVTTSDAVMVQKKPRFEV